MKEGDIVKSERKILKVLGNSDKAIVFIDDKNDIHYRFVSKKINYDINPILKQFEKLKLVIYGRYTKELRLELLEALGEKLYCALTDDKASMNPFFIVEKKIKETLTSNEKRSKFVSISICYTLITSVLLVLLFLFINQDGQVNNSFLNFVLANLPEEKEVLKNTFCCLIGGCVGACFSVIYRKDINLPHEVKLLNPQALIQCTYGMIAGMILFTIVKADLIMGFVKANNFQLFTFSFISGFSERLIPSMINRLETDTVNKQSLQST